MSLSREVAQMNDEQYREFLQITASKVLAKGGNQDQFIASRVKPLLHALHRAGWTKERLCEMRRIARNEFSKAKSALRQAPVQTVA